MLLDLTLSLTRDNPVLTRRPPEDKAALLAAGHIGTHLDTLLGRPIPLEWMDRMGVALDVRDQGLDIGLACLAEADIRPGDFVFFHTGHIDRHPYGSELYFREYPQLDWAVVEALTAREVSFIGIDASGLRRGAQEHARVDRYCEEHGAYVVENLINLGALCEAAPGRFPVRVAWIAHQGATGIPVKVVATLAEPASGNRQCEGIASVC